MENDNQGNAKNWQNPQEHTQSKNWKKMGEYGTDDTSTEKPETFKSKESIKKNNMNQDDMHSH